MFVLYIMTVRNDTLLIEMSKWVLTREPTRLTTGSSRVGLRKIQLFQKWVELNPVHLTHGLNRFKPG